MNLINKVTEESYTQWIEKFVTNVLNKGNVDYKEVIIEDIEFSKRVFLTVDGEEYDIRTWNFRPVKKIRMVILAPRWWNIHYSRWSLTNMELMEKK